MQVLMAMAPKRGDHPCVSRGRTCGLRRVKRREAVALQTMRMASIKGTGVLITLMRRAEVRPTKQRVMRSPRHEAIGGAMLSVGMNEYEIGRKAEGEENIPGS